MRTSASFDPNNEKSPLQSGTEHWNSNYKSGIVNPFQQMKAVRPQWTYDRAPLVVNR